MSDHENSCTICSHMPVTMMLKIETSEPLGATGVGVMMACDYLCFRCASAFVGAIEVGEVNWLRKAVRQRIEEA